ncbi:MAG: S41 family peptidase [Chitinophagales bacterium]|nr:S41 family peptidase [Chitinophagales bacterium]
MPDKKLNFLLPLLLSLVVAAGMIVGFKLRESSWSKRPMVDRMDYSRLDEILNIVDSKYVDTVNSEKAINKLIESILNQLDPHSFYIAASELNEVNEGLEGNFEGIGVEFYILRDTIIVVSPISGGPSEALGILSGDKIILIDDSLVAGKKITNNDVVKKLRGKKGTQVKVSIARRNEKELLDFEITRDKIPITSVDAGYMIDKETGYIKISRFSANTYEEFMAELNELHDAHMQNLIIDLRQNPGGYLNAATMIADELLDNKKLLVYTEGKAYKRKEYLAQMEGLFENGNLAIIIDEGSASASEILAGAVQDWDRGIITGRRSFGKGLVQEQYNLRDGSALRLTVARYFTPSGRSIQKPYDNGNENYDLEIAARYEHGEHLSKDSIHVQDSIQYFTSKGKVVYGGGGIMPDVFIPLDSLNNYKQLAKVRVHIPEFIYDYFSENSDSYKQYATLADFMSRYIVSDAIYQQFISLPKLKEEGLKPEEVAAIQGDIKTMLKAYIARQLWKNDGFYAVINTMDKTFLKTLEIVKNPESIAAN